MEDFIMFLLIFGFIIWLMYWVHKYERTLWYLKRDLTDELYFFNNDRPIKRYVIKHYLDVIDEVLR